MVNETSGLSHGIHSTSLLSIRGVARGERSRRHILCHHAPSPDDGPVTDGDPGQHGDRGSDHDVVANRQRARSAASSRRPR